MTADASRSRRPEVSVVLPTRDRWPFLRLALRSVFAQERGDFEVIVVDDGSIDETAAELARIEDPRLRALRHARSLGVAVARNRGIAAARGEWVAFLDDDDLWAPSKLPVQVDRARRAGASFSYSSAIYIDHKGRILGTVKAPEAAGLRRRLMLNNAIPAGSSNVLAKTDLLRRLGGFDESLIQLEDWDMWIRLASSGLATSCPDVHVAYREHRGNRSIESPDGVTGEFDYIARKHSLGPLRRTSGLMFTRWLAAGELRAGRRRRAARVYVRGLVRYGTPRNLARAAVVSAREARLRRARRTASQPEAEAPAWLAEYL